MNNRRLAGVAALAICLTVLAAQFLAPTGAQAQVTLNFLHPFSALSSATPGTNADGAGSTSGLLRGSDGLFYGTTTAGGVHGYGTVFKIAADGSGFAIIHAFSAPNSAGHNSDGAVPIAGSVEGSDGFLYGTASVAGANASGTLFRLAKDGSGFNAFHPFSVVDSAGHNSDGGGPTASLLFGSDGFLYGTALLGGTGEAGTVYKVHPNGTNFQVIHTFSALNASGDNTDGAKPFAAVVQGADGTLYGTATVGGANGTGVVYKMNSSGGGFAALHTFTAAFSGGGGGKQVVSPHTTNTNLDGANPYTALTLSSNGYLYGAAEYGGSLSGANNNGTLFRLTTTGTGFTVLHTFIGTDGAHPASALLPGGDGALYGTTTAGGMVADGTVFRIIIDGSGFKELYTFQNTNHDTGKTPSGTLVAGIDGSLYTTVTDGADNDSGAVCQLTNAVPVKNSSGFSVSHSFHGADGVYTYAGVIVGQDGLLYGASLYGGTFGNGTLFALAKDDSSGTILHIFTAVDANGVNTDGKNPYGILMQGSDGYLYGTAELGGANGTGTVFRVHPNGSGFQTLHSFSAVDQNDANSDGAGPSAGLTAGTDGFYYGIAESGGTGGTGTVFKLHPAGTNFSVIHTFPALLYGYSNSDGAGSYGNLILGGDGFFYGTTHTGGTNNNGTVFKLQPNGANFKVIHTFGTIDGYDRNSDGASPYAGLTAGTDGFFYGTTKSGGLNGFGAVFKLHPDGSSFAAIHSFGASGSGDSANPYAALTNANGFFYGTTEGGNFDAGAIFRLKANGSGYQILRAFNAANPDGTSPTGALALGGDGALYGTTYNGGAGDGIVFRLSLAQTHILWDNTNGQVSLWTVSGDGSFTSRSYGPYSGWTAKAISDGPDAVTHILWTNTNGQASFWTVGSDGSFTSRSYGPYSGWKALSLSDGPDGRTHLLWNKTDGAVSLWSLNNTTGTYLDSEFGPFAGWKTIAVATGGDDLTDLLWVKTNKQVSGWRLSLSGSSYLQSLYGPYTGYSAVALSAGPDGTAHPLWDKTDGTASVWNAHFGSTAFTSSTYGPFSGWTALGNVTGADGTTHLLWDNVNGQASLWDIAPGSSSYTSHTYGPFSGWTAVAVSAGL